MKNVFVTTCFICMAIAGSATTANAQSASLYNGKLSIHLTKLNDTLVIARGFVGLKSYVRVFHNGKEFGHYDASRVKHIWLDAKGGHDSIKVSGDFSGVTIYAHLGSGNDSISCYAFKYATVFGGDGNDIIGGSNGQDHLDGQGDNDVITGWGDNDLIFGGKGRDDIDGGDGQDTIRPGSGEHEGAIYGGAGADAFLILPPNTFADDLSIWTHWFFSQQVADFNAKEGDILVPMWVN